LAAKKPDSARRSPRQERARATVDAILFAAAHILKTQGMARLTTNRIAALAGVSIGSLYQYFSDKQAIVEALRERHDAYYLRAVRSGIEHTAGAGFREGVRTMLWRMVELHASDLDLHGELRRHRELTAAQQAEYSGYIREFIETCRDELRPTPDPELTGYVLMTTLQHLVHGVASEAPERLRDPHYVDELVELAVRYLGAG
jgi:AcrR family transcriptional regulator